MSLLRFFFQLRVKDKNGESIYPKKNTILVYKSMLRTEIKERHGVNILDSCRFPQHAKLFKSLEKVLVKQGRSETNHHEEVDPATMTKIYELLALVEVLIKNRGREGYDVKLSELSAGLHSSIHKLLQWGAMFFLIMFEVRRGGEGIEFLEPDHFKIFEDQVWDFKYMRKVVSEAEKNQPLGSNSQCHGVIPDMLIDNIINPLAFMETYMSQLPTEGYRESGKRYMFPKPRDSAHFNVHDPREELFEQNMKSRFIFFLFKLFMCYVSW